MNNYIKITLLALIIVLGAQGKSLQAESQQLILSQQKQKDDLTALGDETQSIDVENNQDSKWVRTSRLLQDSKQKPSSVIVIFVVLITISFLFSLLYYLSRRYNRRYIKTTYSEKFENVLQEVTFRGKSDFES